MQPNSLFHGLLKEEIASFSELRKFKADTVILQNPVYQDVKEQNYIQLNFDLF